MFKDTKKRTRLEILQEAHGKKYIQLSEMACKIMRLATRVANDEARKVHTGQHIQTLLYYQDCYQDLDEELKILMEQISNETASPEVKVHGSDI